MIIVGIDVASEKHDYFMLRKETGEAYSSTAIPPTTKQDTKKLHYTTAGLIASKIGDIKRFRSDNSLVSFSGPDCTAYESGKDKAKNSVSLPQRTPCTSCHANYLAMQSALQRVLRQEGHPGLFCSDEEWKKVRTQRRRGYGQIQ